MLGGRAAIWLLGVIPLVAGLGGGAGLIVRLRCGGLLVRGGVVAVVIVPVLVVICRIDVIVDLRCRVVLLDGTVVASLVLFVSFVFARIDRVRFIVWRVVVGAWRGFMLLDWGVVAILTVVLGGLLAVMRCLWLIIGVRRGLVPLGWPVVVLLIRVAVGGVRLAGRVFFPGRGLVLFNGHAVIRVISLLGIISSIAGTRLIGGLLVGSWCRVVLLGGSVTTCFASPSPAVAGIRRAGLIRLVIGLWCALLLLGRG